MGGALLDRGVTVEVVMGRDAGNASKSHQPRGPGHEYYIVRAALGEFADLIRSVDVIANMIERTSLSMRRVLRETRFDMSDVDCGLDLRLFEYLKREELMDRLDPARCGVGISGGGDCAGIADMIVSLGANLDDGISLLGIRDAGEGLALPKSDFEDALIVVDPLFLRDMVGQSSAPFGSARKNPFKNSADGERTLMNIRPYRFFYATGGNDHGGLTERIAHEFPDKPVFWSPKTIDGDVSVGGHKVQSLGFDTAVRRFREEVYDIAQSAQTHGEISVLEVFGRHSGRLAFEGARKDFADADRVNVESMRKIEELGPTVMILVPERPASLKRIAAEAAEIHEAEGSCTVVVAEGFLAPELRSEMQRLAMNTELRVAWQQRRLKIHEMPSLIGYDDQDDPRHFLAEMLSNRELAAKFGRLIWEGKRDDYGNNIKLAGIRDFIIEAIKVFSESMIKVNEELSNRALRGAQPTDYDRLMGGKLGAKMAELVNSGVTGGKAVVYLEGMDPLREEPVVLDLKDVSDKNNLDDAKRYSDEGLRGGGVFW